MRVVAGDPDAEDAAAATKEGEKKRCLPRLKSNWEQDL